MNNFMKKQYISPTATETEIFLRAGICSPIGNPDQPEGGGKDTAPARKLYV